MSTDFWSQIARREKELGRRFELPARFGADADGTTKVVIVLEEEKPRVLVDSTVAAAIQSIDPDEVTKGATGPGPERWQAAFEAAREQQSLSLNEACRLILGPLFRPDRNVHAYNANEELLVEARDIKDWVEGFDAEGGELRLADVYSGGRGRSRIREDANAISLRAIRSILEAAIDFEVTLAGTRVEVRSEILPTEPWPRSMKGLDEQRDGPWPPEVAVHVTWSDGRTELRVKTSAWKNSKAYGDSCGIAVHEGSQELLWITVPASIRQEPNGAVVRVPAAVTLFRSREPLGAGSNAGSRVLVDIVKDLGVPFKTKVYAEAFTLAIPTGEVGPSPRVAFERLIQIALAKLPFMSKISPIYDPVAAARELEEPGATEKSAGIYPLPGGVRAYKETLDKILDWLGERGKTTAQMDTFLREEFDVSGKTSLPSYVQFLRNLGVVRLESGTLSFTEAGQAYCETQSPKALFTLLQKSFTGVLETLVVIKNTDGTTREISRYLLQLLGVDWQANNQISFRRNWLLSMGLIERGDDGDSVTSLGAEVLEEHPQQVLEIEAELEKLVAEDDIEVEAGEGTGEPASVEPPGWSGERVTLSAEHVAPYLNGLVLPEGLIAQACAALSAGKHLLFVGPPGTGKTELAQVLAGAAQSEGYCAGLFSSTASADWTTYETVGGYALQKDSSLSFRSGVFLSALEQWKWLLIDELNRADIDKAFGELMTVLAGKAADTPFLHDDGRLVSIGPEETRTHVMPGTFRVLATMNIWDKTSLFRLSYAVQRRFAIIHVGVPEPEVYAQLLQREAKKDWIEPPLDTAITARVVQLFSVAGVLAHRQVGPAIPLDMLRYMRTRKADYTGLVEAIAMYLLPQLEGIQPAAAESVWTALASAVGGHGDAEAYLKARFRELFPLASVS